MSILKLYLLPFFVGLVLGFILISIFKDQKIIITDYPKPFDNKIYKDKNNTCYQYITKEVNCNEHEKTLKQYPIQN